MIFEDNELFRMFGNITSWVSESLIIHKVFFFSSKGLVEVPCGERIAGVHILMCLQLLSEYLHWNENCCERKLNWCKFTCLVH